MKLQFALCVLPAALAFTNTAPFYGLDFTGRKQDHLVRSDSLKQLVDLPAAVCSGEVQKQLLWVRMAGLDFDALKYLVTDAPDSYIDAVFYASADAAAAVTIDSCLKSQTSISQGSLADNFVDYDVNVVEVTPEAQLAEVTNQFKKLATNPLIWVQGKPAFAAPYLLTLEQVKEFVGDKIGEDLDEIELFGHAKRTDSDDQDASALEAEIESDFRAAESYIIAEGDKPVGMYDSKENKTTSAPSKKHKKIDNLFSNYQFFTPGILLCLIVSFALVGVLYVALGWIASLEITYKSFDKQVDYEKKQE